MINEALNWGTLLLIVIQLVLFAFGYGKLSQKVDDACAKVNKMWDKLYNGGSHGTKNS